MIYHEKLIHTTMEAEKSHNLPSAARRPKKAKGLRTRRTSGVSSTAGLKAWEQEHWWRGWAPGQGQEPRVPGQQSGQEQTSLCLSALLGHPPPLGRAGGFTQSTTSGAEVPSQIHPDLMFNQQAGHPMIQANSLTKSSIANPPLINLTPICISLNCSQTSKRQ